MPKKSQPHSEPVELYPIACWEEADEHLKTIGDLQTKISRAEADANKEINPIKEALQKKVDPWIADIARRAASLQAYCDNHKDDFDGAKSRKLQFGSVGWRFSSSITAGKKCVAKIKAYFGRKAFTYLHVKVDPNKEALEKLSDAELKNVGAKRNRKDTFFAEPELPAAVDY